MNISEPLPENIELEYDGKIWLLLDYEHIPFRCRRCHEYGHLYKSCPLNIVEQQSNRQHNVPDQGQEKDDGFITVSKK